MRTKLLMGSRKIIGFPASFVQSEMSCHSTGFTTAVIFPANHAMNGFGVCGGGSLLSSPLAKFLKSA